MFFFMLFLLFLLKRISDKRRYKRILIVKLSSLGDVIHTLPLVYDIQRTEPDVKIDWVVDASFIDLLWPLKNVNLIPIELRAFKKHKNFNPFRDLKFKFNTYDTIIDAQGLLKSALVARYAKGFSKAKIIGLGNRAIDCGYEPLVRCFYDEYVYVEPKIHSVDRTRALYPSVYKGPPVFYPSDLVLSPPKWNKYVLFFHATTADEKCWPIDNWIELGISLAERGYTIVLPWGNPAEKERSKSIGFSIPGAIIPEAFNLLNAFSIIQHSELVIGVDTGLTHLAAALKHRTVEIYVSTFKWKFEGYWHSNVRNLGDKGQCPTVLEVLSSTNQLL